MPDSRHRDLSGIVRAIVTGQRVEWDESAAGDPKLAEMRVLYEIARVHSEARTEDQNATGTVGAPPPPSIGRVTSRWAHFYLFEPVGEGSSGIVYHAWDSRLSREVALKLMIADGTATTSTLAEARRLARVRHPHIVSVYGADQVDGRVGVWMEFLRGRPLSQIVQTQGPCSAGEAALIGVDVCSALASVHAAGLLHRDVKAQNVVREHGGRIVLMDLGSGRDVDDVTSLDLAGTPLYMAPELFTGGAASVQSDIYSVGVLLYFLTTAAVPVMGKTLKDIRHAHAEDASRSLRDVRPDLPRDFITTVDRALSRVPDDRFASAGDMERVLATSMVATTHPQTLLAERRGFARFLAWKLPGWAAVLLAATAALATLVVMDVGRFFASPAGEISDSRTALGGDVRPLSADQHKLARAVEELASSLAAQGQWRQAAAQYSQAEQIYRINSVPDAPLVAASMARLAWAHQHAGELEQAKTLYEVVLVKLRGFDAYPLMEVTEGALATLHQTAGRYAEASGAIDRALQLRAQVFTPGRAQTGGLRHAGIDASALERLMPAERLDQDSDGDWLPDLLEAAVGLNPAAGDSDGDGIGDGHEDHDRDGISNTYEFGLVVNPTKVIAHYGGIDPELFAFQQPDNRRVTGRSVNSPPLGAAWAVPSAGTSLYFRPLTAIQRTEALTRGWRLLCRGELYRGMAVAHVDLGPEGARFDLNFARATQGVDLHLNISAVPLQTIRRTISATPRWPLTELEYDPTTKRATLLIDGVVQSTEPYSGHRQFLEDKGLVFGSLSVSDTERLGEAAFNLAMFAIR